MAGYTSLLGKAWDMSKKAYQVVSETLGSPATPFQVVEIQNSQLRSSFRADPAVPQVQGQSFRVLLQSSNNTFHVLFTPNGATVSKSIFRSTKMMEAVTVCQQFEAHSFLFTSIVGNEMFSELVELIHAHPNWHTIHLVAHLNATKYLDYLHGDPNLKNLLHIPSNPEGLLPLHVACEAGSVDFIRRFTALGVDVAGLDGNGLNALHHAASSSSGGNVITELARSPAFLGCVNAKNGAGYTPVFLSIRSRCPDALSALLKCGASADEPCHGRLPLQEAVHSSTNTFNECAIKCVKALVSHCPKLVVQADRETGDTPLHKVTKAERPLHVVVERGLVGCVLKFLAHKGDPNAEDREGNTPLHLASKVGSLDVVKALLLFGAETGRKNKKGQTCLDASSQCRDKAIMQMVQQCIGVYTGETVVPPSSNSHAFEDFAQALAISSCVKKREESKGSKMNLLSLDGGGIRGLVLIQILLHLERSGGVSIRDKFEWIGGTSTGAILAIALSLGRSLRECQSLYFRFKDEVFRGARPYDSEVLEAFLREEIGPDTSMAHITSRRLTVTTVIADKQPVKLFLFRNYTLPLSSAENESLGFFPPQSQILWKAARCSSAAPTYFANVDGKFVDGGLIANNPTMDLLTEVNMNNTAANYVDKPEEVIQLGSVLSVGTGQTPAKPLSSETMNLGLPTNVMDAVLKAFATRELLNLFVDQVTAADGRPVERSRAWCNSLGIPYFRFSTHLSEDIALNEIADEKLIKMLWETEVYMRREKNQVQALVDFLKCGL